MDVVGGQSVKADKCANQKTMRLFLLLKPGGGTKMANAQSILIG